MRFTAIELRRFDLLDQPRTGLQQHLHAPAVFFYQCRKSLALQRLARSQYADDTATGNSGGWFDRWFNGNEGDVET